MKLTYGKQDKLKSKKAIEQLFLEGDSVVSYPLRLVYLNAEHASSKVFQLGVSVPKRKVNKAVDRSRIKRVLREVYRLHQNEFLLETEQKYIGMLMYLDSKEWSSASLVPKIQKLALKFKEQVSGEQLTKI
ncbi:MAG: ribonuclease P protein component [Flavicella sp.]